MKRVLSTLYNSSPKQLVQSVRSRLGTGSSEAASDRLAEQVASELRELFRRYQTPKLESISARAFQEHIQSRLDLVDSDSEGYAENELDWQRDLSIKFHWGHDHDFGEFKLQGRMGDRHIRLLANFATFFPVSIADFAGKSVFDIGCWTGGTTLLLAAVAKRVFALEEVKKYAAMASFLSKSFGIADRVSVEPMSLYACNSEDFYDRFDIVHFPGVIYHLTDPLLALRILFNSLRPGGFILIESMGLNYEERYCRFDGSGLGGPGTQEELNRGGWSWFMPSPSALHRMMEEAGFAEVETRWHKGTRRVYGYGKKLSQVGICRAGLSVPGIR